MFSFLNLKMKISLAAITLAFSQCNGYQVSPDPNGNFKKAIEDSVLTKIPKEPLTVVDDETYSPEIACPEPEPKVVFPVTSEMLRGKRPRKHSLPSLSKSIKSNSIARKSKFIPRKLFGLDENPSEYWFHNRIHTLGNTGFFGGIHAALAPFATRVIDEKAYDGVDLRAVVSVPF